MESGEPSDQKLLERTRAGEQTAFRELFGRYRAAALARIRHKLPVAMRRKVDPEDILQDAYLVAAQRLPEFEGRHSGSFGRWLAQIVEFKVRETLRFYLDASKRNVRKEQSRGARADTRHFQANRTSPSQAVMAGEFRDRAKLAMERLPEDYRFVLRLVQVEDLSLGQAAARLDRSYEATKKLYGRAVARFKTLLEEE